MEKKKTIAKTTVTKKTTAKKSTSAKKSTKKKSTKRAFTLIELLAVIIILGVLMIIAIPSVTSYINSSRKSAYITTAQNFVDSARVMVNSGKYGMYDPDVTYYIPKACVSLEKGGDSPYGELNDAYVAVTYRGNSFDYYWISRDETHQGIYLTYSEILSNEKISSDMKDIYPTIAVGDRSQVGLLSSSDCSTISYAEPTGRIAERGFDLAGDGSRVSCDIKVGFTYGGEPGDQWQFDITGYYNEDYTYLSSIDGIITVTDDRGMFIDEEEEYEMFEGGLCNDVINGLGLTGISCKINWYENKAQGNVSVSNLDFVPMLADVFNSSNLAKINTSTTKNELIPLMYEFFINDYIGVNIDKYNSSIDYSKKYTGTDDFSDFVSVSYSIYCK